MSAQVRLTSGDTPAGMTSCLTWRKRGSVPARAQAWKDLTCLAHRFGGGGSELLRNGDKNNVWSIIEEGMV